MKKLWPFLRFAAVSTAGAAIFCWYFNVPTHTENFWEGAGTGFSWIANTLVELKTGSGQPSRQSAQPAPAVGAAAPVIVPPEGEISTSETAQPDCTFSPPDSSAAPHVALLLPFMAPPLPPADPGAMKRKLKKRRMAHGKPLRFEKTKINVIPLYKTTIDLNDPETFITVDLANNARRANCSYETHGDEAFDSFLKRERGAFAANGTFFSKDDEKRVMGNLVSAGEFRKYSQWENYGTTFGIKANNDMEMVTARLEGQPPWGDYWFSITCGPRLLKNGEVAVTPAEEGFTDSHVLTVGPRSAIGYNRKKKQIIHAAFLRGLSLEGAAKLMKSMGCDEAMNLDGGASRALAHEGTVVVKAGRPLTNVLVVYDAKHKAPPDLVASWERFQEGERPQLP